MKIFKSKITMVIVVVLCITLVLFGANCLSNMFFKDKPTAVKNMYKLESLYEGSENTFLYNLVYFFCFPYNIMDGLDFKEVPDFLDYFDSTDYVIDSAGGDDFWQSASGWGTGTIESAGFNGLTNGSSTPADGSNLEFSTTNVQVENVDEADIVKTDGNYVYSLSEESVIITDVTDSSNPVVVSRINGITSSVPTEFMLYNDKLVLICEDATKSSSKRTVEVDVYDLADKSSPRKIKSFELNQRYYTSRMIDGHLYLIACGHMKKSSNDKIDITYKEDYNTKEINLKNMYYFKDHPSYYETQIAHLDLNVVDQDVEVQSYLSDVDNIYVSENNIYIADRHYKSEGRDELSVIFSNVFGFKGIWSMVDSDDAYDRTYVTSIIKLNINKNHNVKFVGRNEFEGETVNQFSFDEYNSNLRVATQNEDEGSRILVFNDKMKLIGESSYVGKDEDMYSSRFIGDRAYLVTYMNTDPLFTFDLSNPKKPKVLGELQIPGYSTYLHPYDENHLIGIGINTEERTVRSSSGRVIRTSVYVTGMKMALFDVSDIRNPKQISEQIIGDSRTKSAILDNHKALLFSKEKELIAIPVTNYPRDLDDEMSDSSSIESLIEAYNYGTDYTSEGYLVYNINLEDGITKKGTITHEDSKNNQYSATQMLRGLYINDYLYTVSQHMLKVNRLDTLDEISELVI